MSVSFRNYVARSFAETWECNELQTHEWMPCLVLIAMIGGRKALVFHISRSSQVIS